MSDAQHCTYHCEPYPLCLSCFGQIKAELDVSTKDNFGLHREIDALKAEVARLRWLERDFASLLTQFDRIRDLIVEGDEAGDHESIAEAAERLHAENEMLRGRAQRAEQACQDVANRVAQWMPTYTDSEKPRAEQEG